MTLNENERLERFRQAVFDEADALAAEISGSAEQEYEQRLRKAEADARENAEHTKKETDRLLQEKQLREISSQRLGSQRNVLSHREELIDRVFDAVREKLAKFRQSEDYKTYLSRKAESARKSCPDSKGTAFVSPEDMQYAELFKGFEVKERDSIELGGVLFVYDDKGIALDYTLDSAVEEQRACFSQHSELAV